MLRWRGCYTNHHRPRTQIRLQRRERGIRSSVTASAAKLTLQYTHGCKGRIQMQERCSCCLLPASSRGSPVPLRATLPSPTWFLLRRANALSFVTRWFCWNELRGRGLPYLAGAVSLFGNPAWAKGGALLQAPPTSGLKDLTLVPRPKLVTLQPSSLEGAGCPLLKKRVSRWVTRFVCSPVRLCTGRTRRR